MEIEYPPETCAGETRVAVTPETAKKFAAQGHRVLVQAGAGLAANATDEAYRAAGAEIVDAAGALAANWVLKVRAPSAAELAQMKPGAALVGMLEPFDADGLGRIAAAGLTGFALEAAPRTTRAQSLDVLSSQANIAGYKAVMLAANRYPPVPDVMTAAGTIKAARVAGAGRGRRRACRRSRHRQTPGRRDRGLRRAALGEGTGRVARRQIHRRALDTDEEREAAGRGRLCAPDAARLDGAPAGRVPSGSRRPTS